MSELVTWMYHYNPLNEETEVEEFEGFFVDNRDIRNRRYLGPLVVPSSDTSIMVSKLEALEKMLSILTHDERAYMERLRKICEAVPSRKVADLEEIDRVKYERGDELVSLIHSRIIECNNEIEKYAGKHKKHPW